MGAGPRHRKKHGKGPLADARLKEGEYATIVASVQLWKSEPASLAMNLSDRLLLVTLLSSAALASSACGKDREKVPGGGGSSSSGASGGSSNSSAGNTQGGTGLFGNEILVEGQSSDPASPTVKVPEAELCNGSPCANHEGSQAFVSDDVASDVADRFEAAAEDTDSVAAPSIVYPAHETMFPVNLSHVRHEWTSADPDAVYQLRFSGPLTDVVVYVGDTNWEPSEEEWDWIAESNRGSSVQFTVAALHEATPETAYVSEPVTLLFSRAAVPGAIYYWSTGSEGVMRARISDPFPEKFYTDPTAEDSDSCVACHTLSRDGKKMALGYDGENLRVIDTEDLGKLVPLGDERGRKSGWTTFSPDATQLLVAADGKMVLLDVATGEPIGENDGEVQLPEGAKANMPDWNGLGDKVVFAMSSKAGTKDIEKASIAVMSYADGAFSDIEVLVESAGGDDNNFFPTWSPDSRYVAYVNAQQKSKDAATAILRMVSADGGAPVELARLNGRVGRGDSMIDLGNSMPRWAPSTEPGIFWLAFSSLRPYASLRELADKEDQIWIAAIDPTLEGDPSYAAFWAPFQNVEDGNHRAFWTVSEEDAQTVCKCVDVCGDGIDNDCDGVADGASCSVCMAEEICGDGIDNNCNCVIDECNDEICNDGIDNDGDGAIDGADPTCTVIR